jgi:hypothetical protein
MQYDVRFLVNTNFRESSTYGYRQTDSLAYVTRPGETEPLQVRVTTGDIDAAASELAFMWGQKMCGGKLRGAVDGPLYPIDVRSISVGDVLEVRADGAAEPVFMAVERLGFMEAPKPARIVPLVGTEATSRPAPAPGGYAGITGHGWML